MPRARYVDKQNSIDKTITIQRPKIGAYKANGWLNVMRKQIKEVPQLHGSSWIAKVFEINNEYIRIDLECYMTKQIRNVVIILQRQPGEL